MRIVEEEEEVTTGPATDAGPGTIRGEGWIAREQGGAYVLEYDAGEIQAKTVALPIRAADYALLRTDPARFEDVVRANGG